MNAATYTHTPTQQNTTHTHAHRKHAHTQAHQRYPDRIRFHFAAPCCLILHTATNERTQHTQHITQARQRYPDRIRFHFAAPCAAVDLGAKRATFQSESGGEGRQFWRVCGCGSSGSENSCCIRPWGQACDVLYRFFLQLLESQEPQLRPTI